MAAKKPETALEVQEEVVVTTLEPAPVMAEEPVPDYIDIVEPPKDANPLVPAIAGLASAAITALAFYLWGRWKKRKQNAEEVIPFEPTEGDTKDNVPAEKPVGTNKTVVLKGDPQVHLETASDDEDAPQTNNP